MILIAICFVGLLSFLLCPRPFYPWVLAIFIPIYTWMLWIVTRPTGTADWAEFDYLLIKIAMAISLSPLVLRWIIASPGTLELDWRPTKVASLVVGIWGVGWFLAPLVASIAGASLTLLAGICMFAAIAYKAWKSTSYRDLLSAAAVALGFGLTSVLLWAPIVIKMAEQAAGGKSYCIVVAHGSDYRPAKSVWDLTPIVMRAREFGHSAMNSHAQILSSGHGQAWSYYYRRFAGSVWDNTPPSCQPAYHFAKRLSWW